MKETDLRLTKDHLIVIGASAGGSRAIRSVLGSISKGFPTPIIIVLHLPIDGPVKLSDALAGDCKIPIKEAFDKCLIEAGVVYCAPSGYHLLVETSGTLALNVDEPVHFSRPAIDVLFETAARSYGNRLVGILLTGANTDGAEGLREIQAQGGFVIVEDPATAVAPTMPAAGLKLVDADCIMPAASIGPFLQRSSLEGACNVE